MHLETSGYKAGKLKEVEYEQYQHWEKHRTATECDSQISPPVKHRHVGKSRVLSRESVSV